MSCSQPVVKPAVQNLVFFHTSKTQTNDGTDHKHKPNSWTVRKQWQPPQKPETIICHVSPLPIQYTHILEKQLPAFCTTPHSSASLSVLIYLVLRCFYSTLLENQVTRYFTCDPCTPGTTGWEALPEIANTHRTVKSSVRARFSRICSAVQLIWSQPPATKLRTFDTFTIHLLDAWAESVQNTTCTDYFSDVIKPFTSTSLG